METVETSSIQQNIPPKKRVVPSFENTEIAFSSRTNNELRRAYLLFSVLGKPLLMDIGKRLTLFSLKAGLPIEGMIKKTIFRQFCGGETIAECAETTQILDRFHIGTILDYSAEGKNSEADFERTTNEVLKTIEVSHQNPHIPFCVFKMTGLCKNIILEKASAGTNNLNDEEKSEYAQLEARVESICKRADDTKTPVFIDAEDSWYQDAIDRIAMKMIRRFNKKEAIVYNTLQMYRHDRLEHMTKAIKEAKEEGFIYAVKLVRGAYMEKERERAKEMGYPSPIQLDKESTDRDFDKALLLGLDNLDHCAFSAGTHNEKSSLMLANEMDRRNLNRDNERIYFAQLFGMSDHISFNLSNAGYNVAKYVPYGPVREVMPYLIRRAEENTSVAGQTSRELSLIKKEIRRRKNKS